MVIPPTPPVAVCSICDEPLTAKGDCLACLLRTGLDQEVTETKPVGTLVFGNFEVEQRADGSLWELGRGAMGVTYLAVDNVLRRRIALKVVEVPPAARRSQAVRDRFLREARSAAALRHPNVAGVFQFGTSPDESCCYYAMELVEGETLETRVRRDGPVNVELALEIALQIARALMAAAAQGLIHRDLKPGNIMLTPGNAATTELEVKVIDFGLAKAITDAGGEMDLTHGQFVGTPNFASPEQFGSGVVDPRSDIYSLGATLWFALTGVAPASGTTVEEIRNRQIRNDLPMEQLVARKVPAPLIKLLRHTLALDPGKRPASARELMEALESCRRKLFPRVSSFHKLTALIVAVGIVLAALFVLRVDRQKLRSNSGNIPPSAPAEAALPEKSIAVLPFENLSKDEENAFFASGVQDEILTNLAKIADLKVISRTSVMKYKSGPEGNLGELAKTLGVSHVIEGSVQRAAGRVRVTAQLIDARTDTHLWAEHYDRDVADVFAIQSEIARQIADQLRARLSPAEKAAIAERPTADLVAYALYTKARELDFWGNWEGAEKSLARKVELLEKATQRDPNFALAYCALAKTHCDLFLTGAEFSDLSRTRLELAKKAADAALRVRPDLGEAHLELARSYFYADDFDRARDELTIARRKLPNDAEALLITGRIDRRQNRWDNALANLRKASELDPRNEEVAYILGETYFEMRRYHELEQFLAEDAAKWPAPDPWTQLMLAQMKLAQGDPVAAQALLAQVPLDFSPTARIWDTRFTAALYLRDYDAAERVIAATPAKFADRFSRVTSAAGLVAVARGDTQKAQSIFSDARKRLDTTWGVEVRDERYFAQAAELDAGLGRKEEAIREARRALELRPIARDSLQGPEIATTLALVYAWTGERDRALEQLEIVAKIPAGPSYGDLRFNPCWDSLRGDKRFDKIVAAAKAAGR
jgi:serine/threonine protein kinase/tetratricopeptide (TPR) repeat protein